MIEPSGHRVLIKPKEIEEKTESGIYLPQQTKDMEQRASQEGTVIAIGPNAWKAFDDGLPWAAVGDTVLFARYGGVAYKDKDSQEYRLLNDEDVIAVIK